MNGRGFTLVELVTALGLGAIVLAGVVLSLANGGRRQAEADATARLQERAAFALGVLEPEIHMAGYGGLAPLDQLARPAGGFPAGADACGHFESWPLEALRIGIGPWGLRCAAHFGGLVEESHRLTVLRAGTRAATAEAGRVQVMTHRSGSPPGFVFDGQLPAGKAVRAGSTELHDLLAQTLYVAARSDGSADQPALRVKELTAIAGRPAMRDTEVVDGIDDLRIEEGWHGSSGGPLRFGPPGSRPVAEPLRAVRVSVRARSGLREPGLPAQRLTYAGRSFDFHDGHRRLAMTRTFALRNPTEAQP